MVCGLFVFGRKKRLNTEGTEEEHRGHKVEKPKRTGGSVRYGRKEGGDVVCYGDCWGGGL
jgi:hypothetical protein